MRLYKYVFLLNFFCSPGFAHQLEVTSDSYKKVFSREELLKRSDIQEITVLKDPAYGNKFRKYKAIPIANLFKEMKIDEKAVIVFKSKDGFSAPLSKQRLLNTQETGSVAYLAVEPENERWPAMNEEGPSPGPFYLIWEKPELSDVGQEEWPFQLTGFEVKSSLDSLYPKIFPSKKLSINSPVQKGFQTFLKNCFACHTMNGQGSSQFGPDLNLPMNPTEYFKGTALKSLIRNSDNVRSWRGRRMPSFSRDLISNNEMRNLIAYLGHMAESRNK